MASVKLNSGYDMPMLGFGTWKSAKGATSLAVQAALDAGYTHIDCAYAYGNEEEVGEGIAAKIGDGSISRDKLFVTTKLWNTFHRPDIVRKGFLESLNKLGLKYVDLYLMHWPVALKEDGPNIPKDADGNLLFSDADYVDAYKEMEKLVDEGLARSIGISNFNSSQLQRLLDNCRIKPAVHQFEIHPYRNQQKLIDFTKAQGIQPVGYSPFGSPDRPWAVSGEPRLLDDPKVAEIASRLSKSPAQVLIRYAIERGLPVLPKSATPSRIKENNQIWDFKLTPADLDILNNMENGYRAVAVAQ